MRKRPRRAHSRAAVTTVRPTWRVRRTASPVSIAASALESTPTPQEVVQPAVSDAVAAGDGAPRARKKWTAGRLLRWTGAVAGLGILIAAGWSTWLVVRFQRGIYVPLPPTPTIAAVQPTVEVAVDSSLATRVPLPTATPDRLRVLPPGRFNILVLGTDKRPDDVDHWARSDTILLANVDKTAHKVHILTIPRDLVINIPGYGENKVNAAYLFGEYYQEPGGGQALAVRALSQFFDVPIDYYVAVNFDGFRKVIDTVGGIDIDVPYSIDDLNYPSDDEGDLYGQVHVHFDAGLQHMDGKTALRYARTRHADGDFARSKRQLQILVALRQKMMSLDLLPRVPDLMDQLAGMVETNIGFDQQLGLAQLAYDLGPSGVVTASIDSTMITPVTLDDGSEGLKLDWSVAQPVLDDFFGISSSDTASVGANGGTQGASQAATSTGKKGVKQITPSPAATRKHAVPTPTSTRVRVKR